MVENTNTFRVRFRFRLNKSLNIPTHEYRFRLGNNEAVLCAQEDGVAIGESKWLVMNIRGFTSESEARAFASKLRTAVEVSSVATRLGIDPGTDLPTSAMSQIVKDRLLEKEGVQVRDNVHGIDVFPDDQNVIIFSMTATGTVRSHQNPFLSDLTAYLDAGDKITGESKNVLVLLNYALMTQEPTAQIVFAISAVEMLGQQEKWSNNQSHLIDKLAQCAEQSEIGTENERQEVSDAIRRSTHKIGLRQGVMRLLDTLQLGHLKKPWDKLYRERTKLVHGLAPEPGANYSQLGSEAITLCGQILLKVIAKDVAAIGRHIDTYYKI